MHQNLESAKLLPVLVCLLSSSWIYSALKFCQIDNHRWKTHVPHYNQEIQKENEKFISHFITPFPIPAFNNIHSFFFISSFIYLFIVLFFIRLHFPLFIDLFTTGCGSLVNNSLISPGYPYPDSVQMECVYSVPIPSGKAMKIYFEDFDVGYHRWYGCK